MWYSSVWCGVCTSQVCVRDSDYVLTVIILSLNIQTLNHTHSQSFVYLKLAFTGDLQFCIFFTVHPVSYRGIPLTPLVLKTR